MPSYNHAPFVEAAVRSVCAQEGVRFELWVIDDGSPDESPQILRRLQEELGFFLKVRENKGALNTMAELAGLAKGRYICSFASDDVMPQGRLQTQAAYMETHPEAPVCLGQARRIFPDGTLEEGPDPRYLRGIPQASFDEIFLGKKELHGCTELVRKTTFDAVGGYHPQWKIEDFPLWLALSKRYGPLPVLDEVFCHYRIHGGMDNLHRKLDWMLRAILDSLAEYKEHPLYPKAVDEWKAGIFSSLASANKRAAWHSLMQYASFSWPFIRRLPKLFIPQKFLREPA
jgi:glycosyltransferase involved in cell wall biosynthesis